MEVDDIEVFPSQQSPDSLPKRGYQLYVKQIGKFVGFETVCIFQKGNTFSVLELGPVALRNTFYSPFVKKNAYKCSFLNEIFTCYQKLHQK